MKEKGTPLVLAVLTALLLLTLLWPKQEPVATVVVAARDLGAGTVLQASDLRTVTVPRAQAPRDAVDDPQDLVGQTLAVVRFQGEPITPRHLGPAVRLQPDEAGIGIRVKADTGLAGLLRPGMRVGVVATLDNPMGDLYAKALITGVRVLYVPPEFQARPYEPITAVADGRSRAPRVTGGTRPVREGVLVVAASTRPQPLYLLTQEAQDLLGEGKLALTADGTLTVTVGLTATTTVTDTVALADLEKEREALEAKLDELQPQRRYIVPVEALAALNARGDALTLALVPQDREGAFVTAGFSLSVLSPGVEVRSVEVGMRTEGGTTP